MTRNCEIIGCGQEGLEHIELVVDVPTVWGGATTKIEMFVCPGCRNKIWDQNAYISQSRARVFMNDGEFVDMTGKLPTFTGFNTERDLLSGASRIMPGAFKEQLDVPFKKGLDGEVLGKAHVKPDGTVGIELNDAGEAFMKTFNGFDFSIDENNEEDDDEL